MTEAELRRGTPPLLSRSAMAPSPAQLEPRPDHHSTLPPRRGDNRRTRVPELDGIRGMAILLVLTWHYLAVVHVGDGRSLLDRLDQLAGLTWSGVDLFFVLSGYLIAGILLDNRDSPNYFQVFYIRRACRIVPLYVLVLGVFAAVAVFLGPHLAAEPRAWLLQPQLPWWSYATFTQNLAMVWKNTFGPNWLGVTWSLAVEEQFYLLLPFLIRVTPRRGLPWVLVAGILAALPLRWWLTLPADAGPLPPYVLMPCRLDALLLGSLCAWAWRERWGAQLAERARPWLYSVAVAAGMLVAGLLRTSPQWESLPMARWGFSVIAVLDAALLVLAVSHAHGPVARVARWGWLRWLGIHAYGLYLWHQPMNGLCHAILHGRAPRIDGLHDLPTAMLALSLTLLLAAGSWALLERPCVNWGQGWKYSPTRPKPAAREDSPPA